MAPASFTTPELHAAVNYNIDKETDSRRCTPSSALQLFVSIAVADDSSSSFLMACYTGDVQAQRSTMLHECKSSALQCIMFFTPIVFFLFSRSWLRLDRSHFVTYSAIRCSVDAANISATSASKVCDLCWDLWPLPRLQDFKIFATSLLFFARTSSAKSARLAVWQKHTRRIATFETSSCPCQVSFIMLH